MAASLIRAYLCHINRDWDTSFDIIDLCHKFIGIGRKGYVLCCAKCNKILKITEFSKSQMCKGLKAKCKQCIQSYQPSKKRKPKTAKKPLEISIYQCRESIMSSYHSELNDSYFGVIVANIILSYSHILIEGIYRFGHIDDRQWSKLKNQSDKAYKMHKLVLKPIDNNTIGGRFRWQYEYYQPDQIAGESNIGRMEYSDTTKMAQIAGFECEGRYNINIISDKNKLGGKTEIELKFEQYGDVYNSHSYRGGSLHEIIGIVDCDRDLVMSFKNKQEYGNDGYKTNHYVWLDIDDKFIELTKLVHSVWIIPS